MPASFAVARSGHGTPMLLLPGAACDASLWEETAHHLPPDYSVSAVTLAGFGGVPPIETPLLESARAELADYLRDLAQPAVVVGHSMGGFLAYALAIDAPEAVAAVVAVDGVPSLRHLMTDDPNAGPATLANMDEMSFRAWLEKSLSNMSSRPRPELARLARLCHRETLDRAMHELWESDLRREVGAIAAPVLLVLPGEPRAGRRVLRARAEAQLQPIRHHDVVVIESARHMILLDAPAQLADAIREFANAILAPR
ncbi:MAG TPA: alpha/beta hydrolase [Polyangiaceae bacterium]|nr:alpha/beta hydrolase [Polyangiaceae bacterium]